MVSSEPLEEFSLKLPMSPGMELEASRTASEVAASMQMSPDKIDAVGMAVVEAFINASEHSHSADRTVYLTFTVLGAAGPEKLRITLHDRGAGFDPGTRKRHEQPVEGMRKRGWGLKIIEGLMDEVEIRSTTQGTTIVMSKLR
jgi:anti-sigma regulatory factor (Ser/Thr protein kinase)